MEVIIFMKKLAAALLLCVLCLALIFPGQADMGRYNSVFMDTFDTVITLIAYSESKETYDKWSDAVHQQYVYMHKLFDTYHSYEDEGIVSVYTLNQKAAKEPIQVDPILYGLLKFCKSNYELCQSQTNIAMGSVLSIWHNYRDAGLNDPMHAELPPMEMLEAATAHIDINNLILDDQNRTVYFADPDMKLDVGAVAKGYATEVIAQMLLSGDMRSFIISAGGNVRLGRPPQDGRRYWGVGIQDPDGAILGLSDIVETLFLSGSSVVTSGDYQRYYTVDGKNYHHLIDPDTLMPADHFRSVSIITKDSGWADMLSTAAYLMPYEQSRAFIESLDGVEAMWIFPDGSKEMTDGAAKIAKSHGATNY